ncbi:MAG TPA: DUF6065 family protein [Acetobacteraceae bacterium]|nr:DUF6065 family protein [Acetobacteraceae bacterium]
MTETPIVEFFRLIRATRPAKRAERAAAGYLPSRGMRYCDALTSATGFGYWVFPPLDIRLLWDGEQIFWSYGEDERWMPLSGTDSGAVQFPDYATEFDASAPEAMRGYSPPFLTALPEVGGVQMWTGLLARTRPGWSLSVRPPVNIPAIPGVVAWEGIIETDLWFGPLFTNFRLTRTDTTVHIRSQVPIIQVQPLPQLAYREETLSSFACSDAADLSADDWGRLGKVLLPNPHPTIRQGEYAVMVRKRRLCPFDPSLLVKAQPLEEDRITDEAAAT